MSQNYNEKAWELIRFRFKNTSKANKFCLIVFFIFTISTFPILFLLGQMTLERFQSMCLTLAFFSQTVTFVMTFGAFAEYIKQHEELDSK